MTTVHILFACDAWHTQSSREVLGIYTSKQEAVASLIQLIQEQDEEPLSPDDQSLLLGIGQTQNYEGSCEFIIEELELNKPLTYELNL